MSTAASMNGTTSSTATPSTGAGPAPGATATGVPGGSPSVETVNPGAWQAGFSDDLKGFVTNKGFKGPADVVEAYRNFEKLQGVPQDRLLKLPDKFYDDKGELTPEGRSVFERVGLPKDAKDYQVEVPKEGGDPKLAEHFKNIFHKLGLPKPMAEKIFGEWNQYQNQAVAAVKEAQTQAFNDQVRNLTKEWGNAMAQNTEIAKRGAISLGLDAQKIDALSSVLGHAETMKVLHKIGSSTGESSFVTGKSAGSGVMEPATARAKIAELRNDRDFSTRLLNGETQAKETWQNLHQQAYPGQSSLR